MLTTVFIILLACASPVILAALILVARDRILANDQTRRKADKARIGSALRQFAPLAILAVVVFVLGTSLVAIVEN